MTIWRRKKMFASTRSCRNKRCWPLSVRACWQPTRLTHALDMCAFFFWMEKEKKSRISLYLYVLFNFMQEYVVNKQQNLLKGSKNEEFHNKHWAPFVQQMFQRNWLKRKMDTKTSFSIPKISNFHISEGDCLKKFTFIICHKLGC